MELALFSRAFAQHNQFDIYHVHVSNREWLLPFARVVDKPVLVTMHGGVNEVYNPHLFAPYKDLTNVHFISISNNQRIRMPDLPYYKTIYHGVNVTDRFTFSEADGEWIMWAGRGIPAKGVDQVVSVYVC